MTSKALVVVATLTAKARKGAELCKAFLELERHSRTEEGCIKYEGMSRTLLKLPRLASLVKSYAASARRSTPGVAV